MPADVVDELWRLFRSAIAPLQQAGGLVAVHFQFAPWVTGEARWREHVQKCVRRMQGHLLAVEYRNQTWLELSGHDLLIQRLNAASTLCAYSTVPGDLVRTSRSAAFALRQRLPADGLVSQQGQIEAQKVAATAPGKPARQSRAHVARRSPTALAAPERFRLPTRSVLRPCTLPPGEHGRQHAACYGL